MAFTQDGTGGHTVTYDGSPLAIASTGSTVVEFTPLASGHRVTYPEATGSGGGLDTEAVQDVVGAMVSAAGGTYNDAAGTITLPASGSGSLTPVSSTTTTAAGSTPGELVGYLATAAVTVNGESVADGDWVVFCWDGAGWALVSTGTLGGSTPLPGDVTPLEPTFTDPSDTTDDRYVIPSQSGVVYSKGGTTIAAGTYTPTAGEAVTITAAADAGYTITSGATTSWSYTFSTAVANTAPSMTLGTATITGLEVSQPFTTSDVDGDPVTVTADWGDGTTPGTVTSPAAHTYATGGSKTATFTPHDDSVAGAVRTGNYTLASLPPVGSPATFQQAIIDYGAIGYWKLNETAGTTISDSSGNARNLTLMGSAGTDYTLAGKDGYLQLKTASGYAEGLASAIASIPAKGGLTVLALVHMLNSSGGGSRRVVSKRTSLQAEWGMLLNSRNINSAVWRANPSVSLSYANAIASIPANAWTALAVTFPANYSAEYPTNYFNSGTPQASTTGSSGTGKIGDGTAPLWIGGGHIGGIAHVAVIPHRLTDAHIQKLMDLARAEGLIP